MPARMSIDRAEHAATRGLDAEQRACITAALRALSGPSGDDPAEPSPTGHPRLAAPDLWRMDFSPIFTFRMLRHMTQAQLSRAAGISTRTLSRIETSRSYWPTSETLARLAYALDVPLAALWRAEPA